MAIVTFEILLYIFCFFILFRFIQYLIGQIFPNKRSPPCPFRWPIIGNLHIMKSKDIQDVFIRLTHRYGPVFNLAIGPFGVVCLTKYEVLKEALIRQGDIFAGRPRLNNVGMMERGYNGLAMTDGEQWKIHKRFTLQTLKEFGVGSPVMEEKILSETRHLLNDLNEYAENGQSIQLVSLLELHVGNIMADITFGCTFERRDEDFKQFLYALGRAFELILTFGVGLGEMFPILMTIPYVKRWIGYEEVKQMDLIITRFLHRQMKRCEQEWEEHARNGGTVEIRDFTTAFLKEMRTQKDNDYYGKQQWLGLLADLWMGGTETTTVTLDWMFLFMCLYPHVQTNVQREIDTVIGRDIIPRMSHKNSLPYTQAVICECQRFANVAPLNLPHRVLRDTQLNGYDIPANTWVLPQISSVLWDPTVFPNPDQFNPNRFLDEYGCLKMIDQFIPFSLGKRACPGERLAKVELFLIITNVLQKYRLEIISERPNPPTSGIIGLTKRPYPYQCKIIARDHEC